MHQVKAMLFRSKDLLKNVREESPKNVNIGSENFPLSMLPRFRIEKHVVSTYTDSWLLGLDFFPLQMWMKPIEPGTNEKSKGRWCFFERSTRETRELQRQSFCSLTPSSIIIHYHPSSSIITMISRWCWNWQSPNSHPVQRQCCLLPPQDCIPKEPHFYTGEFKVYIPTEV